MKYFLLIVCLTLSTIANAGSDEKLLKQANAAIAKKEFQKAADALEKVSGSYQTSLPYLQSAALAYDSLKQYKKAIRFYSELPKDLPNAEALETRTTFLKEELAAYEERERIRAEKMKNCTKCSGTGFLHSQVNCHMCGGKKSVVKECSRCKGNGRTSCSSCGGTGSVEVTYGDRVARTNCTRCNGEGSSVCNAYCNRGTVVEECRKCNATGIVTVSTPCDLH
ncbi:MAG TPA: hypothetical protein VK154_05685 [Chitinophagales bacterium]|nr:hypothetical protein [Chitinophagales bacterium]